MFNRMVKDISRIIMIGCLLGIAVFSRSQAQGRDTLNLAYCLQQAQAMSPLKKQELLNASIFELNYKNSTGSYWPSLFINGKATYQSEVITIPGTGMIPEYPEIPKGQFNVSLNLQQNIYDGGLSGNSKQIEASKLLVAEMDLEAQLYQIAGTINGIYFTLLNLQEREKILYASLETLQSQLGIISARVKNGVLLESNLYGLKKQVLNLEQDIIAVESDYKAMTRVLSEWIGEEVSEQTVLIVPDWAVTGQSEILNRPELGLFNAQKQLLEAQYGMTNLNRTPKIWAFAQGGIGQPNPMNFFETDPSTYYIFGLQLNWDIFDWGITSRKKQVYRLQQSVVDTRKQDFERNINMALIHQNEEIEKLKKIIERDAEIIDLQEKIVQTAFSELENGVILSTDYLLEVNTLIQAKTRRAQHELDLSHTVVTIHTTTGNINTYNFTDHE